MPNPEPIAKSFEQPPKPRAAKPRPRARTGSPAKPRKRKKARGGRLRQRIEMLSNIWRRLNGLPPAVLATLALLVLAATAVAANAVHWTIRKPTALLAPLSRSLTKTPAQTWAAYGDLFHRFSTASLSPELLAALAQIESSGNWAAQTYWRWDFGASDVFGIYRPASSSVGMYQMTEGAFVEAKRYCIRDHAVVAAAAGDLSCGNEGSLARVVPAQAIELTAVWLERSVTRVLAGKVATPAQKRDLAAVIHLCGGGPAKAFVRRGFHLAAGQRCGDHDPAAYLAQVRSMERQFRQLAVNG